jgi:hypothetical protein
MTGIESDCGTHKVPICDIKDIIIEKQCSHLKKTGKYLSVPNAIIEIVKESKKKLA